MQQEQATSQEQEEPEPTEEELEEYLAELVARFHAEREQQLQDSQPS